MKAKLLDRILLALLLLFTFLLSAFLIALSIRVFPLADIQNFIVIVFGNIYWLLIMGGSGLILLLITLKLVFSGSGTKKAKETKPTSTLIKTSEFGSSFITLAALDSMVQKHCKANTKIKSITSAIIPGANDGITISIKLSIMPDTQIPELIEELQQSLKEYIEKLSGITVTEIGILIEDAGSSQKSRVE